MLKNLEKIETVLKLQRKCLECEKTKKVKKDKNRLKKHKRKCYIVSNNVQKLLKTRKILKKVKGGRTDGRTDRPT